MNPKKNRLDKHFKNEMLKIALPVSLQCILQSSFSLIDQIMIGQFGTISIAAIGISGKFISLFSVMIQALASVAGIIIAQAVGKRNKNEMSRGLCTNLFFSLMLAILFTLCSIGIPEQIMGIYSNDSDTISVASHYLSIYAISFIPFVFTNLFSAFLRCMKETKIPLYASLCSVVFNTGLNYVLIYGKLGFPRLEIQGAAIASVISQIAGCIIICVVFWIKHGRVKTISFLFYHTKKEWCVFLKILLPLFVCEFAWTLGENVYGYIYGHLGTKDCAAMTIMNPIVALSIGAMSGVAQAAGNMVGERLGAGKKEEAYLIGRKLLRFGFFGTIIASLLLLLLTPWYICIFQVEEDVHQMATSILIAFAIVCPVKVANMVMGSGILRSGGKTHFVMIIDLIGTWGFGIPLGLITAFYFGLPNAWVYFILSQEELLRLCIGYFIFQKKSWMKQL